MKSETTLLDIHKWLGEGKKIRRTDFDNGYYVQVINNDLVDSVGDIVWYHFANTERWELYQEPEEKEKYFQIYFKAKSNAKPYATTSLFTSKEEFLQYTGIREENLEFFHMEEVENHLENV